MKVLVIKTYLVIFCYIFTVISGVNLIVTPSNDNIIIFAVSLFLLFKFKMIKEKKEMI